MPAVQLGHFDQLAAKRRCVRTFVPPVQACMTEQSPQFSRTQKTVPRMHSISQGHLQQPRSEDEADMRGGEPQHSREKEKADRREAMETKRDATRKKLGLHMSRW
jgi:hypothetical protein